MLVLKLTNAFSLQTHVASPFLSEMLLQVQKLPYDRIKQTACILLFMQLYLDADGTYTVLRAKKKLALEPKSSLFLQLQTKNVHFNTGKKQ